MLRRTFLVGVSSLAILAAAPALSGINNPGSGGGASPHNSLLIGLNGPNYFSGFSPFLNWWKTANTVFMDRTVGGQLQGQAIWDAGGYLNTSTGELVNPVPSDVVAIGRLFYVQVNSFQVALGATLGSESFIAKWDGSATGNIDFLASGGTQDKSVSGQISFTQGSGDGSLQLKLTITNVNDPPRNIRIYQTRYATNVANGETFNPDWLAQVRKFRTLRLMDWQTTNNTTIVNFSQLADMGYNSWAQNFSVAGTNCPTGPKGAIHPDLICTLANATGCNVHVCIPLTASDAFVTAFATYMQANTSVEVTYELSNECWNFGFDQFAYCQTQGSTNWPGDAARAYKWYGYQSARFMKIIRDVYNDRTRWRGALATQTVSTTVTNNNLVGVNYYLTNGLAGALVVADLYKSLYVTGYFGDVTLGTGISAITAANPAQVTSNGHGLSNGNSVRMFVQRGPTSLNNTDVTVTVVDANNYTIGVNTSAMASFSTQIVACRLATSAVLPDAPTYANGASGVGATLTAGSNAALVVDTVSAALNDRIVVKNQVSTFQNGIYTVTTVGSGAAAWVLTRATDFDQAAEMLQGSWTNITAGGFPNSGSTFTLDANVTTVGTTGAGFTRIVNPSSYSCPPAIFDLMDQSNTNFINTPATYPTKYTYFNQQIRDSFLTGSCSFGYSTSINVAVSKSTYWPNQLTIAQANGLTLRQYEGGSNVAGNLFLSGFGGQAQFTEFAVANAHSAEMATVYAAMYSGFPTIGGEFPAKFVEGGQISASGCWGGISFWPSIGNGNTSDITNPVWLATLAAI